MKFKKSYAAILLSVILTVVFAVMQVISVGAEPADPQKLYDDNKDTVAAIDDGNYFAELLTFASSDASYVAVMEEVVKVADKYVEYDAEFKAEDYMASDWTEISHIKALTLAYVKLSGENYLNYNTGDKYLLRILADEKTITDDYQTLEQAYAAKKAAAAADVAARKEAILKANTTNPDGKPETVVGYYDQTGVSEVEAIKSAFDRDLEALTLDKSDYNGSVQQVNDLAARAKSNMASVRKNVVERAYDKLSDYYAIEKGTKEGDAAAAKSDATRAINGTNNFFNNATPEVKKEYSNQKKAFEDFFDENEIDDSAYVDRSYIATAGGEVTITATDEAGNELTVFPAKALLKVYNLVATSPKRHNAETAIAKINDKLAVGYFIEIEIVNSVEKWTAPTEYDGKTVVYHVAVDLDGYYNTYAAKSKSMVSNMLGLARKYEDQKDKITDCADYLKSNDGSLCYWYFIEGDEGAVKSLKYSLEDGTLMFETNMLGNLCITVNEMASYLTNPLFWLLAACALVLLIILIVLLVKFARYRVVFYSNGGTHVRSVRARKGESFVMPNNPTRDGYIFAGWYEDIDLTRRFVTTVMTRRRKIKVYAKWAEIIAAPVEVEEPAPAPEATPAVAPVAVVVEPAAESAPAEPTAPTDEKLTEYYAEVRKTALGYALAAENEKAVDGMMLIRAYKKDDGVYVYAAIDPEASGAEKAEGALAADTPAMLKVTNDEELAKAKELIGKTMTEYGLEPTGKEVGELKEGASKGFGYRLKFEKPAE